MITNLLLAMQESGTVKEAAEYAARQAASPGLELFAGGDTIVISGGVVLLIILLLLLFH